MPTEYTGLVEARVEQMAADLRTEFAGQLEGLRAGLEAHVNSLGEKVAALNRLDNLDEKMAEVEQMAELLRPLAKEQAHGPI